MLYDPDIHIGCSIPTVLYSLRDAFVQINGYEKAGVWRINGEKTRTLRLRQKLNMAHRLLVTPDDVHCIASLIKQWYTELPAKLFKGVSLSQLASEAGNYPFLCWRVSSIS